MNTGPLERAGRDSAARLPCATWPAPAIRYDMVQVRYTIGGDNGPVDPALPDFVKSWNETFADAAPRDRHRRCDVRGRSSGATAPRCRSARAT